jgi:DnaJ-domain-containing protein 1
MRILYRLGRGAATGMLTLAAPGGRSEVLVLRRGAAVCADADQARRALVARLARLAAEPALRGSFDAGVAACPPGALHQVALAGWVRSHLEAQLDGALADRLVHELAGARLVLRAELAPLAVDDADRRMLAALDRPRGLDQIWPLARAPRFRLLAFVHFLRAVGAITAEGVPVAPRTVDIRRLAALRLLGIDDAGADPDAVKRAYRRLARTLHPDLQPGVDDQRRRTLERRFAEVTAAYEALQ